MKTRKEVDKLKKLWLEDTEAFDLTRVEGYEEYREELEAFVETHTPDEKPSLGSFLAGGMANMVSGLAQNMLQPSMDSLRERIAFELIRRALKNSPEGLTGQPLEQYYNDMGYDAYLRTHHILNGRDRFRTENCDCPACNPGGYKPGEKFR